MFRDVLSVVAALYGCDAAPSRESTGSDELPVLAEVAQAQQTLEEDFSYPNAEAYRASGIVLKRGDGNMLLVDCAPDSPIRVEPYWPPRDVCFSVRGPRASLELELDDVYYINSSLKWTTARVRIDNAQEKDVRFEPPGKSVAMGSEQPGVKLLSLQVSP